MYYSIHLSSINFYLSLPSFFPFSPLPPLFPRSHTRAYTHHLLIAHELLGEILLCRHNQAQLSMAVEAAAELIRRGDDASLAKLERAIRALQ